MEHRPESGFPPVYHDMGEGATDAAAQRGIVWPRLFVLTYVPEEAEGIGDDPGEVVLYGLAMPGGGAVTVGPGGMQQGHWVSAGRAADRLGLDLWWRDELPESGSLS
ncbi:hypothetical protein SAMN04489712_105413 [Thermomonospora echinospora]|uniref:Uncharacterized protein n=1 Tax=Thermomonospora echinospora TaxID=1992 RepID=A0A1H6AGE1_9ACTN|nr:hypothetical protein [Thermomonospora echinospora]SEG47300.1 hypothetical protein SAMN04489712_105413 [Thermomonospora echinospora]